MQTNIEWGLLHCPDVKTVQRHIGRSPTGSLSDSPRIRVLVDTAFTEHVWVSKESKGLADVKHALETMTFQRAANSMQQ
eukprot:8060684-Pyramimonas_sp.AAC.1